MSTEAENPENRKDAVRLLRAEYEAIAASMNTPEATGYDADNLAEAILDSSPKKGFRLFQSLLQKTASADWERRGWNPVSGLAGSMDFFHRVRAAKPASSYKLLFG